MYPLKGTMNNKKFLIQMEALYIFLTINELANIIYKKEWINKEKM